MRAADLKLLAGRTFRFQVSWHNQVQQEDGSLSIEAVDITACDLVCEVRRRCDTTLLARADLANGGIVIDDAQHANVSVTFAASATHGLAAYPLGEAVYELICQFPNGDVHSVLRGLVEIETEITQL